MAILVTGANGFIGSRLCKKLIVNGEDVCGLVRKKSGKENFETIEADLTNIEEMHSAFQNQEFSAIFHVAAKISAKEEDASGCMKTNVLGTFNLLSVLASLDKPPKKFIYSSSQEVYGPNVPIPVAETVRTAPANSYGLSKLLGEEVTKYFSTKIPVAVLRYGGVYGKEKTKGLIGGTMHNLSKQPSDLKVNLQGDGKQTRDFVWVDDVVNANLLALSAVLPKFSVFNIGCGEELELNQIIETISKQFKKSIAIHYISEDPKGKSKFVLDISEAKKHLKYSPTKFENAILKEWV